MILLHLKLISIFSPSFLHPLPKIELTLIAVIALWQHNAINTLIIWRET